MKESEKPEILVGAKVMALNRVPGIEQEESVNKKAMSLLESSSLVEHRTGFTSRFLQ